MPGTRIALSRTDYLKATDKSWIYVRDGLDVMRSITLDISTFSPVHIADGAIPSGIALGRIAATGKYGPFSPEESLANAIRSLVATGGSAGDFTLTFEGETTAAIAYNANAAAVQAALEALDNVNPGDVQVTGGPLPTTPVVIEFQGQYRGQSVSLTKTNENVTGGDAVVTSTQAGGGGDGREVFAGHLFEAFKVEALTDPDGGGALFWKGVVRYPMLPTFTWGMGDEDGSGVIVAAQMEGAVVGGQGWANHGNIRYEGVA